MLFKIGSYDVATSQWQIVMRCPACRLKSLMEPVGHDVRVRVQGELFTMFGQRRCPVGDCNTHVFFVAKNGDVLVTYPAELIDFDSSNIPVPIVETLTEALTCHAHECYKAASMMIRKALELLCEERGAAGKTLQARIQALQAKVVLPPELLEGMTEIRFLGNDAAHVESKEYDTIGREEVEIAVDITKVILQAVYQYSDLVSRLKARKPTS